MFTHDFKEALASYYLASINITQSIKNGFINIKKDSAYLVFLSKTNMSLAARNIITFEADKIERSKRNSAIVVKDRAELEYLK